jgi:hypothetical protein
MTCHSNKRLTFPGTLRRQIAVAIVLLAVTGLLMPAPVLAWNAIGKELVVGGGCGNLVPMIWQDQSYSAATKQTLAHKTTQVATDTEAFTLGAMPGGGLAIAQTSDLGLAASDFGFFTSTASGDIIAPIHIGNGFLGTLIGDPLSTGTPIFAGMMFPQMTKMSPVAGVNAAGANPLNVVRFKPVINDSLNNTAVSPGAVKFTGTSNASAKATPAPAPVPGIKPGQVFYHQQNKPFSTALTYATGPFKATPEKVQNMSSWDRFLMNTVARSPLDKSYDGTTSRPTYFYPDKGWGKQVPAEFITGALKMTQPGTHIGYRSWPL